MKKKQHWLTLRTENDFAVLKFDKENYRQVLAELETHQISVQAITEDDSQKSKDKKKSKDKTETKTDETDDN